MKNATVIHSPLGKNSAYISHYQPDLIFPIQRKIKRDEIGISASLPFFGGDRWNAFEISWLNAKGKPMVALGEFVFPCASPNLIESKSFKLYLNSFNNTQFESMAKVTETLQRDLSAAAGATISVKITSLSQLLPWPMANLTGICLDDLDISCDTYTLAPHYLLTEENWVTEVVYSDLLKSNCLVTGQPDWGSIQISYTGKKINHAGLLKYIISLRNHNEFHEQCVERIYMDILNRCAPQDLTVAAYYTRRGGLDINPYRSSQENKLPDNMRLCRQ